MRVELAEKAGACYGVNRALELAQGAAARAPQPVHTLGPLIHNPLVVAELEQQGVGEASSLDEAGSGTVVIRSHGTSPQLIEEAHARGFNVVDATCPFVAKVQQRAVQLGREGYAVVIVGEEGHAEVEGIRAWGGAAVLAVVEEPEQLPVQLPPKVGVVVQTTQSEERYQRVLAALEQRCQDLRAFKTICSATQKRQEAAARLAARSDVMLVLGGRNSGNTRRLVEVCSAHCPTHHIESAQELQREWFGPDARVGVTAGASTPQSHVDALLAALEGLF
ncbi:MAG: 4-hydroxy-3-methylbut-2-enyl diphosphate reductase [Coriobacteriales bacterium]